MSRFVSIMLAAVVLVAAGGWVSPASAAYSSDAAPSWVPNGNVKTVTRWRDVVYIGGEFTSLKDPVTGRSVPRNRVAALDADSGEPLSWNPGANGAVEAIDVDSDGTVYLGGSFTSVAGSTATRVAAVTPAGGPLPGFRASANSTVFDLEVTSSSLYLGGSFGSVNGRNRPRLARVDAGSGALVDAFSADVSGGRVLSVELSEDGSSVLFGGAFTAVGGAPRGFLAAVAPDNGAVRPWAPNALCDTCYLWDVTVGPGAVYAAMSGPGGRVVAWDWGATADDLRWSRRADGDVQAIAFHDGVVYGGGHFGPNFSGETRHQLVALNAVGGAVLPWNVEFTGRNYPGIWDLHADADGLRLGGGFTLAGDPARKYAFLPAT